MIRIKRLTPELRQKLKLPLGLLIRGSPDETMKKLLKLIEIEAPLKIVSVGDVVSENLSKHNIVPQVIIVDNKVMRKTIKPISVDVDRTILVKNPPGTLTDEVWEVMSEVMKQGSRIRIIVDGEEDLIAMVAILCSPEGSIIIYGQPYEGIVVVKVTKKKKDTIRKIVEAMEKVS